MKKALIVLVLLLAACGEDEDLPGARSAAEGRDIPGKFYEVEVNGMPCIVWMKHAEGDHWAYSGLDCDWRER